MSIRIKITLQQEEYSALLKIALAELRDPESQAKLMILKDLERRGVLSRAIVVDHENSIEIISEGEDEH